MKRVYSLADFGVKKHQMVLKNGLKVIFIEKPFAPIYAKIVMAAGSLWNPSDNGLAHMTEHLLMNGSKNISKENFYGIMESIGGLRNAFTAKDWMSVNTEVAIVEHLPKVREFFTHALESIYVTEEMLQKEKEVIFSELQKARSNPHYDSGEQMRKILAQDTPYSYSNLGKIEGINAISVSEVEKFFETYCVVENMVLVIAGGCTLSDIENTFSDISFLRGEKAVLPQSPLPVTTPQRFFCELDLPQTDILAGFNGPLPGSRDSYVLGFAMNILHNGMNSHFYRKIRNEKALAYSISNIAFQYNEMKYIGTEIGVPQQKVDEATDVLIDTYRELLVMGISQEELSNKAAAWGFSAKRVVERSIDWVEKFDDCLFEEIDPVVGDFPDIHNFRQTVTEEEVRTVFDKYIQLGNFHLCVFGKHAPKQYF